MAGPDKRLTKKPSGESGVSFASGIIIGEEYNPKLQGVSALRVYDEMRRSDATVNSSLDVVKLPIQGADWGVDPASSDEKDKTVADVVETCLFHFINFPQALEEILTYLEMGFSLFEMHFEPRVIDGQARIALVGFEFRKQTTIAKWEMDGGGAGVTQQLMTGNASIPEVRLVRFTNKQEGQNLAGRSVLRTAYKHWYIKDKLYRIDAVGHERQALGVVEVITPKGAKPEDLTALRKIVRNLRANQESYIEHPEGYTVQFMDMKAKSLKDVEPSINHHDRQISKNVLAQFLEIGASGGTGTRSTSEDHSALLNMARENIAKKIVDTLQNTVVRAIVDLNFNDVDYPTLRVSKISEDNIPVITEAVAKLVDSGALHPTAGDENSTRKMLGWQELQQEELDALYAAVDAPEKVVKASTTAELKQLRASIEKVLYEPHSDAA